MSQVIAPRFKIQYDLDLAPAERLRNYGLRKAIRIAVNRAAARIKAAVAANAQASRRLGHLIKSLRIRVKVYRQFTHVAIVGPGRSFTRSGGRIRRGPRKGERRRIRPGRYAHLVERVKPFIRPAQDGTALQFREEVTREIAREIQLEMARQRAG